jgi:hypothetical protein
MSNDYTRPMLTHDIINYLLQQQKKFDIKPNGKLMSFILNCILYDTNALKTIKNKDQLQLFIDENFDCRTIKSKLEKLKAFE